MTETQAHPELPAIPPVPSLGADVPALAAALRASQNPAKVLGDMLASVANDFYRHGRARGLAEAGHLLWPHAREQASAAYAQGFAAGREAGRHVLEVPPTLAAALERLADPTPPPEQPAPVVNVNLPAPVVNVANTVQVPARTVKATPLPGGGVLMEPQG